MKEQKTMLRDALVQAVAMLTAEETAAALKTTTEKIHQFRRCGLLRAIQTGKNWMFPQSEILRFQAAALGADLSNPTAIEAFLNQ